MYIFENSICRWDCNSCDIDEYLCTSCAKNTFLENGKCFCRDQCNAINISPLVCATLKSNSIIEDRCSLEYYRFIKGAYYSSWRELKKDYENM